MKVYAGQPHFFNLLARNEENTTNNYKIEIYDQNNPLGSERPALKILPLRLVYEDKEQQDLEKRGILVKNNAVKCADLSVFSKLREGHLIL